MQVKDYIETTTPFSWVQFRKMMSDFTSILLLLLGATLVAIQFRVQLALGTPLGDDYNAQPILMFVILVLSAAAAAYLSRYIRRAFNLPRSRRAHFINLVVALALSFFGIVMILPDVSLLQMLYYVLMAILLGLIIIWWTPTLPDAGEETTLFLHLQKLWERRSLLRLWTTSNIQARYAQAILGILWIGLLPLSQSLIMALVFSRILPRVEIGPVPFVAYFLTSLTFWNYFNKNLNLSTVSIRSSMGIIGRVYFPREILVLVSMAESTVDLAFMMGILLFITSLVGVYPTVFIVFVPLIFIIQAVLCLGLMLFISYLSVIIRDVPQLITIILRFMFYLTPILYPASRIPEDLRFVFIFNPLVGILESYRDVLLYNRPPDLISLYFPLVLGATLLYTGYLFFKANELNLADYV